MSKREYKLFLKDIIDEINRINKFLSHLNDFSELNENDLVLYAILKCFENIGEASKHIPEQIKTKYPYFWREISGLRDIIVHHYWGVDLEIIKNIIEEDLPELKIVIEKILEDIKDK